MSTRTAARPVDPLTPADRALLDGLSRTQYELVEAMLHNRRTNYRWAHGRVVRKAGGYTSANVLLGDYRYLAFHMPILEAL